MDDTRERVIRQEAELKHLSSKVEDMSSKVDEMHQTLQQAKGAKWALIAIWVVAGAFLAKIFDIIAFFQR